MKKITLLLFFGLLTKVVFAQCTSTNKNENTATIADPNTGFQIEITDDLETNEYLTIGNLNIGENYRFTNTHDDGTHEYIIITNTSNQVIMSGNSPLDISNIQVNTVRMHIRVNSSCSTDTYFHIATIQNLTNASSTCHKPTIDVLSIKYLSHNRIDLQWYAPAEGISESYEWEVVPAGNAPGVGTLAGNTTNTTSVSTGEVLASGVAYDFLIRTYCGVNGYSDYLRTPSLTTKTVEPPLNDFCEGAILLIQDTNVGSAASANATAGDLAGAAGTNVNAESCDGSTGNAIDDVWYKFIAQTTDINITVEPNVNVNFVVTLYSGDCSGLTYLDCSDANGSTSPTEEINFSGLVIGDVYYVRTYYFNIITTSATIDRTFDIKIWSPTVKTDSDNDGYSDETDCAPADIAINPSATEIPDNGIDEDCDGADLKTWYADADSDTYGDSSVSQLSNSQPSGYVDNDGDCNDTVAAINPAATEVCDGMDNDCDGLVDDDDPSVTGQTLWYADNDGDGYGDPNNSLLACNQPTNYVANSDDNCPDDYNPDQADTDGDGKGDLCDDPLAISEQTLQDVLVSPNPFKNAISIQLPDNSKSESFSVILYDISGRVILNLKESNDGGVIEVNGLQSIKQGVYLVKIASSSKSYVKRLVKR